MKRTPNRYPYNGDNLVNGNNKVVIDFSNRSTFVRCGTVKIDGMVRIAYQDQNGKVWSNVTAPPMNIPGENNVSAKLTKDQTCAILIRAGMGESPDALAKLYNITPDHCKAIIRGRSWSHIDRNNLLTEVMRPEVLAKTKAKVVTSGSRKGNNKLTRALVEWAREQYTKNGKAIAEIANTLRVTRDHMRRVLNGSAWKK